MSRDRRDVGRFGTRSRGRQSMSTDVSSAENEGGAPIRTARVPKYYRLKKHLLDMTETLPPGTPVPPERTLAAEFDTSRTTVRQALQELVVEGRLERIQGKGTFVAKPKVSQALQLTSYTEDMRAQGLEPTSQLLDIGYITADDTPRRAARHLGRRPGAAHRAAAPSRAASRWPSRRPTSPRSASPPCAGQPGEVHRPSTPRSPRCTTSISPRPRRPSRPRWPPRARGACWAPTSVCPC